MSSKAIHERLARMIGQKTYTLLKTHSFPIAPEVCLFSLRDSFAKTGFTVTLDDQSRTISFTMPIICPALDIAFAHDSTFTYSEAMKGKSDDVPQSIYTMDNVISHVFSDIRRRVRKEIKTGQLDVRLERLYDACSDSMNLSIMDHIYERRDAILMNKFLLPSSSEYVSHVLEDILDRYDLDVYEESIMMHQNNKKDVVAEAEPYKIMTTPWAKFVNGFMPSPDQFERFFWGAYLHEIHKLKGYDLQYGMGKPIERIMRSGSNALMNGKNVKIWGEPAAARLHP